MLGKLLKGSAWSELSAYMSPAFFEVVPPLAFFNRARGLATSYTTRRGFDEAERQAQAIWARLSGEFRGDALLELYFAQLLRLDSAVLDLRHDRFTEREGTLVWTPGPLFVTWDATFLQSIRNLYAGFYGDDEETFDAGLNALGLASAKEVMRAHFGAGQERVEFHLSEFRDAFHQVFVSAKKAGAKLHPDFLPFGSYLACLYEHLEKLGGRYDVKAAYLRAAS